MGFLFFLILLGIGFGFGRLNERNHFNSIKSREAEYADITITNTRSFGDGFSSSQFVTGNVVISIDYFKRIAAALKTLFGGRIESYSTLVERARREAVLRMKEDAIDSGYDHIANVRLETSMVFANAKTGVGSLEVYAYGTALK